MSNFTEYAKLYLENEEKIVKALQEIAPLLLTREQMEKNEPNLEYMRASEVKIRKVHKEEEAEKERRAKEKQERKRKAEAELKALGSSRKKRGGQDPPKSSEKVLDNTSNTF